MQDWKEEAIKRIFLIADAPGHGDVINGNIKDSFALGSPDGLEFDELIKEIKNKDIDFDFIMLHKICGVMVGIMLSLYEDIEVKDMSQVQEQEEEFRKKEVKRYEYAGDAVGDMFSMVRGEMAAKGGGGSEPAEKSFKGENIVV